MRGVRLPEVEEPRAPVLALAQRDVVDDAP
jgi:hypothetical protein